LGRWLSRDPVEEDDALLLYSFVRNRPLDVVDRNGLDTWWPYPDPSKPGGKPGKGYDCSKWYNGNQPVTGPGNDPVPVFKATCHSIPDCDESKGGTYKEFTETQQCQCGPITCTLKKECKWNVVDKSVNPPGNKQREVDVYFYWGEPLTVGTTCTCPKPIIKWEPPKIGVP